MLKLAKIQSPKIRSIKLVVRRETIALTGHQLAGVAGGLSADAGCGASAGICLQPDPEPKLG